MPRLLIGGLPHGFKRAPSIGERQRRQVAGQGAGSNIMRSTRLNAAAALFFWATSSAAAHPEQSCAAAFEQDDKHIPREFVEEFVPGFLSGATQRISERIAGEISAWPIVVEEARRPEFGALKRHQQFTKELSKEVLASRQPSSHILSSWIDQMSFKVALACFPAFRNVMLEYKDRVEAQAAELKIKEKEANERARLPQNVLSRSYALYISIKKCFAARESYALAYVTAAELDKARRAIKNIEEAMEAKGVNANQIWASVELSERGSTKIQGEYSDGRRYSCQRQLKLLFGILRDVVPESQAIEKDF